MYPAWVGGRLFIRPGSEKKCLSGLARRKVDLRKVVYWSGSERGCLSGLARRKVDLRSCLFGLGRRGCLSSLARRKVDLRKVVYPAGVGEGLV